MDLEFVLGALMPYNTLIFKEGHNKTLSNVVWDSHKTYSTVQYESLDENKKVQLVYNEELKIYTDTDFIIPTIKECEIFYHNYQRKADAMTKLRSERDIRINASDKYAFHDYPIRDETRKKWLHYRQHLRDLPAMSSPDLDEHGELIGVEWPELPE